MKNQVVKEAPSKLVLSSLALGVFASFACGLTAGSAMADAAMDGHLTGTRCVAGKHEERVEEASLLFAEMTKIPNPRGKNIADLFPNDQRTDFEIKLQKEVERRGCAFKMGMQISRIATYDELINALADDTYQLEVSDVIKPGFKAVLAGNDSDSMIFIETTADGFKFHECGRVDLSSAAPIASEKCPPLGNGDIFTPVDEMFRKTSGIKHSVLLMVKAVGTMSLYWTQSFPWSLPFISSAAQSAISIFNPTPLAEIQRDRRVRSATQDVLRFGRISAELDDGQIVTRIMPFKYADLKQALLDVTGSIFNSEFHRLTKKSGNPVDPKLDSSPAQRIEKAFHDRVNRQYKEAAAAPVQP